MMSRILSALLTLVVAVSPHAWTQESGEPPLISVSGRAEVRVTPDEVLLTLGVETFDLDLATAKAANDVRIQAVLAVAIEHGISRSHLQTDYLNIEPHYEYEYERRRNFVGYAVRKTLVVTLRDIDKFESLLSGVLEAGANYVHGIDFRTTELRRYRDQARSQALKAAKEKAAAMAAELGLEVGEPRSIQEGYVGWWSSYGSWWGSRSRGTMTQNVIQNVGGQSGEPEGPMTPGQLAVTAEVRVSFVLR